MQEIHDIKENKISSDNKYYNCSKNWKSTDPTAQMEHNKHPKEDTDDMGVHGDEISYDKLCLPLPIDNPDNLS